MWVDWSCCTWALHHCLFRYISSYGLSQEQHQVLSSFGPDGFSGSLPELKLGWCWQLQLWLSVPPWACYAASWTWEHTTKAYIGYELKWEVKTPNKAQNKLSLNKYQSDALVEGNVETYNFLLFFIGGVVHIDPLTIIIIWPLAETGTFPPICVRKNTLWVLSSYVVYSW